MGSTGPDLLSLDAPATVDSGGGRAQRGEVGTGLGLGEQLAPNVLPGEYRLQEALLLRIRAELDDRRAGEVLPDRVEPVGCSGAVHLLGQDCAPARVHAAAAVLLGPARPCEAGLEEQDLPRSPERQLGYEVRRLGPRQLGQSAGKPVSDLGAKDGVFRCVGQVHDTPCVVFVMIL